MAHTHAAQAILEGITQTSSHLADSYEFLASNHFSNEAAEKISRFYKVYLNCFGSLTRDIVDTFTKNFRELTLK